MCSQLPALHLLVPCCLLLLKSAIRTFYAALNIISHSGTRWLLLFFFLNQLKKSQRVKIYLREGCNSHLPTRCLHGCTHFYLILNHDWVVFLQLHNPGTRCTCARVFACTRVMLVWKQGMGSKNVQRQSATRHMDITPCSRRWITPSCFSTLQSNVVD